jgi:ubiquinone/menaquinone biosynthesis C-methylase UbiE
MAGPPELNPQAREMADESMVRTLAAQADAIWPQEQALVARYRLPAAPRILDAGCGTGEISARLARMFPAAEVVGVDLIDHHLALARARHADLGPRLRFEAGTVYGLERPDASFDLTVCRHVIHAIPHADRVVRELVRVTRPGGVVHVVAEDYGMLHFSPGRVDPDEFWREGPRAYGDATGTDLHVGRKAFGLLRAAGLRDVTVDHVVVDTQRVPRATFAAIMTAWRDGYVDTIAAHTRFERDQVAAYFEATIAAILDPEGYAVWFVPVIAGVVPRPGRLRLAGAAGAAGAVLGRRAGQDRLGQEPRQPGAAGLVEVRREPRVADVHPGEPAVDGVRARVEPARDVGAVVLDQGLDRGRAGRVAGLHPGGQRRVGGRALALDLLPLGLAVAAGPAGGLLVGVGVAPAPAGLVLVRRGVEADEQGLEVIGVHRGAFLEARERGVDRRDPVVDLGPPGDQGAPLLAQRRGPVEAVVVEHVGDLVEREAQLAEEQDLLQAQHVAVLVEPVARRRPRRRPDQADLVVVVQQAHRHAGPPGQLSNRVGHLSRPRVGHPGASRRVRVKARKILRRVQDREPDASQCRSGRAPASEEDRS